MQLWKKEKSEKDNSEQEEKINWEMDHSEQIAIPGRNNLQKDNSEKEKPENG